MIRLILLMLMLAPMVATAQENIESFDDKNLPVLNDDAQDSRRRIIKLQGRTDFIPTTQIIPLANGGTGASLTDPGADRLYFWDESASLTKFLTLGTGLGITDTTINATLDVTKQTAIAWSDSDNTGDIPITAGERYMIFVNITACSADMTILLRFNSDSGASDYAWNIKEIVYGTAPTEALTGDDADSEIELGTIDTTGARFIYNFIIDNTQVGSNLVYISGSGSGLRQDGATAVRDFDGIYVPEQPTSFELVTSTGTATGTINYYKFD